MHNAKKQTMVEKRVLLKDIAREVGVSVTLVSFVLSGKEKEQRVGKAVAEKIRRVAEEMNYRPNLLAQSLRHGRTYTIGFVVADISNPFFARLARVIESRANERGYSVIFANSNENAAQFQKILSTLRNKSVDGFIIVPIEHSQEEIMRLQQESVNFVLLDRYFPQIDTSYVAIDNYTAACNATRLLLGKGCVSPLYITYKSDLIHMAERRRGFLDTVAAAGIKGEIAEIRFSSIKEEIETVMKTRVLTGRQHDSIFFASNTLSQYGLKCLFSEQKKIFEQLPIVSFDYSDSFDFTSVPYLLQPIEEMGVRAVDILVDMIEDKQTQSVKETLPVQLIV